MRVTQDELLLTAHFGFSSRLTDVVAATLTYQRDKRTHDRLAGEARDAAGVLATARRLADQLPPGLDLLTLAEAQDARAAHELDRAAARLRTSTDTFFDTVGGAVGEVVRAMEAHHWALDRPKLLAALRDQAGIARHLADTA